MSEELEQPVHESPKLDEMVKAYIAIRTARENLYRQYKTKDNEFSSELTQLEQVMIDECNALNVESVRTYSTKLTNSKVSAAKACNTSRFTISSSCDDIYC